MSGCRQALNSRCGLARWSFEVSATSAILSRVSQESNGRIWRKPPNFFLRRGISKVGSESEGAQSGHSLRMHNKRTNQCPLWALSRHLSLFVGWLLCHAERTSQRPISSDVESRFKGSMGFPARLFLFPVLSSSFPVLRIFFPDIQITGNSSVNHCFD